ncbi:Cytoplasmic 60S subunit biogenesis factor REI1 [Tolypocladium ophioglossoides CBS 100239]|uniref:Cytoplasmic 60S subunit biogenesis factor REI1 n=1 Tax=Tolypocladium ophioglossoides (strain CBS 100239) TaxID=1163406 RepID=A0A0L0N3B6_TOLOC|nr:Cytoplasmic 60S subunit biogenesis factor REI1 [Tolypocladium ophioglossoides CBS 100239]
MASANAGPGVSGTAASHPYTCNTCQVAYRNIDLQKGHMKSDWHRYNLKRRVASLPPISSEVFSEKVVQARAASTAEADKAYFERACDACSKTYYSENAYQNHLLSQKHKQNLSTAGQPRPDDETTSVISSTFSLGEPTAVACDEVDSDAENEFNQVIESLQKAKVSQQRPSPVKRPSNPHRVQADKNGAADDESATTGGPEPTWTVNSCIFCNYESPTASLNASHMERFHGMFIPEKSYLTDLDGLIKHLQRQVSEGHECLSCRKMKSTVFGVQTHMRDKGHCKIPYTSEVEQLRIGDFYDFRSTYSDGEDDESDVGTTEGGHGGAKLGPKRREKVVGADGEELAEDEDADGWETDSSVSSLDSADLTAVPAEGHIHQFERLSKHPHHSHNDPRNRHQVDGWHSRAHKHVHAVFYDDYELHLPSGKSVGHRSLNKYFRQNLNNYPTPEERAERLAIEGSGSGSGSEQEQANGDRRLAVRDRRGRELLPRGALGMVGVSDEKKREVRKIQQRGRDLEKQRTKRNDWAYGKANNNQKGYYYRYDGGG